MRHIKVYGIIPAANCSLWVDESEVDQMSPARVNVVGVKQTQNAIITHSLGYN